MAIEFSGFSSPYDFGRAGEYQVVRWLKNNSWDVTNWDTKGYGSTDIEAKGGNVHLLIQVKTYVTDLPLVTANEKQNIKNRAKTLGAEAWIAYVHLSPLHRIIGATIDWHKL